MGGILGIFEDGLTGHAIGINGVAKTLVGYLAASVGALIDTDAYPIRLLLTFFLSLIGSATYFFVFHFLLGLSLESNWMVELYKAIGNSLIAVVAFPLLDRTKIRD
jgi:rod shape-determining protein MreD